MPTSIQEAVSDLKNAYAILDASNIDSLLRCYSEHAIFKDPFQEVKGHPAIKHVFLKMYEQLLNPTFEIQQELIGQQQIAFLWDFKFSMRRWNKSPIQFTGVSWLYFDSNFLVEKHHDFWDPSEGIYEHLPLIGPIMRGLKSLA
jgi:steroid Delta-isomerase